MSTNSECRFYQVETQKWYYVLEDYDAPKNAWDWREHASAYGPFATLEKALQHLDDNHASPGGYCECPLPEGQTQLDLSKDETLAKLIASATRPLSMRRGFGPYRF